MQLNPELYRYSSTQYNPTIHDYEIDFKAKTNIDIATNGYINLIEQVRINLEISYIKLFEGFDQHLHLRS